MAPWGANGEAWGRWEAREREILMEARDYNLIDSHVVVVVDVVVDVVASVAA